MKDFGRWRHIAQQTTRALVAHEAQFAGCYADLHGKSRQRVAHRLAHPVERTLDIVRREASAPLFQSFRTAQKRAARHPMSGARRTTGMPVIGDGEIALVNDRRRLGALNQAGLTGLSPDQ